MSAINKSLKLSAIDTATVGKAIVSMCDYRGSSKREICAYIHANADIPNDKKLKHKVDRAVAFGLDRKLLFKGDNKMRYKFVCVSATAAMSATAKAAAAESVSTSKAKSVSSAKGAKGAKNSKNSKKTEKESPPPKQSSVVKKDTATKDTATTSMWLCCDDCPPLPRSTVIAVLVWIRQHMAQLKVHLHLY